MQQRFSTILIVLACLCFSATLGVFEANAGFFSDNTLVTIGGKKYTDDDFKSWWRFWRKDAESQISSRTLDEFINWQLLRKEAENIGLADTPSFKRQTRIFLQSRTLLMLKNEEINSRINVTDTDVSKRYEQEYLPRWNVIVLYFKDKEQAATAWQQLSNGTVTVEEIQARDSEAPDSVTFTDKWYRPNRVDPGWQTLFEQTGPGKVIDPSAYGNGPRLHYLKEIKGKDEEDFATVKENIRRDLWKEQENAYTIALLDRLREEYQIKVDEDRLAALDINGAADSFSDIPIITSTRQNYSEKEFVAVIGRLMRTRPGILYETSEDIAKLKAETLENVLSQSLTNWGSLDRHYEEKEPFKSEYDFNYGHRLVLALENQIAASPPEITEEQIRQYYQDNIDQYTQPLLFKFYIIDEAQGPIDKLWADVAVGKKFRQGLETMFEKNIEPSETPASHLDPEIKAVLDRLNDGETSPVFTAQGTRVLVHLVERIPEGPLPLEDVQDSIRKDLALQEKIKAYLAYTDKLKKKIDIEIKEQRWKAIVEELGGK
jgi:parvulin-like peptidyl-prolyl isomerase